MNVIIANLLIPVVMAAVSLFSLGVLFWKHITIVNVWVGMVISWGIWNLIYIALCTFAGFEPATLYNNPWMLISQTFVYGLVFYKGMDALKEMLGLW